MYLTTYRPRLANRPPRRQFSRLDDFFAPLHRHFEDVVDDRLHPAVDIYEKDDKLIVEAEMPGLDKKDIKVDVKGRVLTLSGEHTSEREEKEDGGYRRERRFGRFERSFTLPYEVTDTQIDAVYKNGVLTLTVDKPEEMKAKQITIN